MSYSLEIGFYPIIYMLQQNFRSSQYYRNHENNKFINAAMPELVQGGILKIY